MSWLMRFGRACSTFAAIDAATPRVSTARTAHRSGRRAGHLISAARSDGHGARTARWQVPVMRRLRPRRGVRLRLRSAGGGAAGRRTRRPGRGCLRWVRRRSLPRARVRARRRDADRVWLAEGGAGAHGVLVQLLGVRAVADRLVEHCELVGGMVGEGVGEREVGVEGLLPYGLAVGLDPFVVDAVGEVPAVGVDGAP